MSPIALKSAILLVIAVPALPATAQIQLGAQQQQLLSISLRTARFDAARRFYMEVVGLKELPGSTPGGKPAQSTSLSFSGSYADSFLTITHDDTDRGPIAPGVLQRLVFKVADTQVAFDRARATGAPVVEAPHTAHGIKGLIVALVRDPDGNMVELVQTPSR